MKKKMEGGAQGPATIPVADYILARARRRSVWVVVGVMAAAFLVGLAQWLKSYHFVKKSYENVQQIRMYQPDEVTIFIKMADNKIVVKNFQGIRPIFIEDVPVGAPMRVDYKNCDALGFRGCVEMHVHSLDEVESWGRFKIPLPDE